MFEEQTKDFIYTDEFKEFFGDWEDRAKKYSVVTDIQGYPKIMYHQTSKEALEEIKRKGFKEGKESAGKYDPETPYGFFFKSHDKDIGLEGKEQLKGYLNIRNPFVANDRNDMVSKIKSDEYHKLLYRLKQIDISYNKKLDEAIKNEDYLEERKRLRKKINSGELSDEEIEQELKKARSKVDNILEEWKQKYDETALEAKIKLNNYLKSKGYDGFILHNDEGGMFKSNTDTYVIFSPKQFMPIKK